MSECTAPNDTDTPKSQQSTLRRFTIRHLDDKSILWDRDASSIADVIREMNRTGINTEKANFAHANLRDAKLSGALLDKAHLPLAKLAGADLSNASMRGANLAGADLRGTNLSGADLTGANLHETNLTGADLTGTKLNGTNMYSTNVVRANLTGASLVEAEVTHAFFEEVDLTGADLSGANLFGTRLYKIVMSNAKWYGYPAEAVLAILSVLQRVTVTDKWIYVANSDTCIDPTKDFVKQIAESVFHELNVYMPLYGAPFAAALEQAHAYVCANQVHECA